MTALADPTRPGTADLVRALGILSEPPTTEHRRAAESLGLPGQPEPGDYVEVFLLQAYPYASVYLGESGMMGGDAQDRVAGFWRALGLRPPPEPDHLAALLGLYAALIDSELAEPNPARAALRAASRRALLWEHLLSWCPPYLDKVVTIAPPYYRAWAELLLRTLLGEAARLGPQAELPLALRAAPPFPGAAASAADWVTAILAPVRSGFIITRNDLGGCARQLDLGLRVGERAFMLRALLEQDAAATLGWLADEAERAASWHAGLEATLGDVASFWRGRAVAAAAALRGSLAAA